MTRKKTVHPPRLTTPTKARHDDTDTYGVTMWRSVAVVCLSVAVYRMYTSLQLTSSDNILGPPLWNTIHTSKNYTRIAWNDSSSQFSLELTKNKVPTVITSGPAKIWGTLADKWDMHNLIPNSIHDSYVLKQCRRHSSPLFVLERERDKGGMIGKGQSSPVQYEDISLAHFSDTLLSKEVYFYWTGLMSLFSSHHKEEPRALESTFSSLRHLSHTSWEAFHVLDPELEQGLQDQGDDFWEPMLWLSHPGVVAQTHFDSQHNFFTTIFGTRRFTFFPPSQDMHPYPSIHRSNRQSQLHLEEEADAIYFTSQIEMEHNLERESQSLSSPSSSSSSLFYQIDLQPGETLYIPPYWHHRVESLTPSLGVSVSSPSAVEAILQQAYWHAVPLGSFRTQSQKRSGVQLYLQLLVEEVCHNISLQQFAMVLYKSRFSLLFPPAWMEANRRDFSCNFDAISQEDNNIIMNKFHSTVESVSSLIDASGASDDIIERVFLSDYIEQMSRWAVGPDDTVLYIYYCLGALAEFR
jgi:hypothetical protein